MIDEISSQIKVAMKAKDKDRLNALRYVKSLLLENKTSAKPINEQDVIIAYKKKLNDSLEMFKESTEKVESITKEIKIVMEFMPKQLEESEVISLIEKIKTSQENPNMGSVMKELSPQIKGQFDGKKASQLVKSKL